MVSRLSLNTNHIKSHQNTKLLTPSPAASLANCAGSPTRNRKASRPDRLSCYEWWWTVKWWPDGCWWWIDARWRNKNDAKICKALVLHGDYVTISWWSFVCSAMFCRSYIQVELMLDPFVCWMKHPKQRPAAYFALLVVDEFRPHWWLTIATVGMDAVPTAASLNTSNLSNNLNLPHLSSP